MKRPKTITEEYLNQNPDLVFVFGDNQDREGLGGAAALRYHKQSYGFITKVHPDDHPYSSYTPENYPAVYLEEMRELRNLLKNPRNRNKTFLITKLGSGLANRYGIWEKVIEPTIKILLKDCKNVEFLW